MQQNTTLQLVKAGTCRSPSDVENLFTEMSIYDELMGRNDDLGDSQDSESLQGLLSDLSSSANSVDSLESDHSLLSDDISELISDVQEDGEEEEEDSMEILKNARSIGTDKDLHMFDNHQARRNLICDKPSALSPSETIGIRLEELLHFIQPNKVRGNLPLSSREIERNDILNGVARASGLDVSRFAVPIEYQGDQAAGQQSDDSEISSQTSSRGRHDDTHNRKRMRWHLLPFHLLPLFLTGIPVQYTSSFKDHNVMAVTLMRLLNDTRQELHSLTSDNLLANQASQLERNLNRSIALCERSNDIIAEYDLGLKKLSEMMTNMSSAFNTLQCVQTEKVPPPCTACDEGQSKIDRLVRTNGELKVRYKNIDSKYNKLKMQCNDMEKRLHALELANEKDLNPRSKKRRRKRL